MNVDDPPITGSVSPSLAPAAPVQQPAKRKRVTKACLVCAKSRRKCDGVQPQCGTCVSQNVACAWSDVPTRRGPPKGYRRGAADPASLIPKIAKIREHVQALQVAYGESYVLDQLHRTLFNGCEHWVIAGVSGAAGEDKQSPEVSSGKVETEPQPTSSQTRLSPVEEWVTEQREEQIPDRAPFDFDRNDLTRYRTPEPREPEDDEVSVQEEEEDELDEGTSSGKAFLATSMRYMSRGGSLSPPSRDPRSSDAQVNLYAHTRYTVHPDHPMTGNSSIGMALQPVAPISDEQYSLQSAFGQPTHQPSGRIQAHSLAHRTSHGATARLRRASPYPPAPPSIASSATAPSLSSYSDTQSTVYGSPRDSYSAHDHHHQPRNRDADTQHQAHPHQQKHFHRYHHPSSPTSETVYHNTGSTDAGGGSSGNNGRVTTHGGHSTHVTSSSSYTPSEAPGFEASTRRSIRTRPSAPSEAASAPDNYQTPQPSPSEVELLLKTYWAAIHPHWPILYKPKFDDLSLFTISSDVPHSLLYAIYALAARLVSHDKLSGGNQAAEEYRRIAEAQLQAEGPFKSHINKCEALFLLSLYYHGEGNQRQAWVLSGLAAMMAFDLGLHKTKRNHKLPMQELEQQIRVFWNIYVYEKVLAAEMGRPVMIRSVHCEAERLAEDQSDEYETLITSPKGEPVVLYTISIFNAAVDLFSIMERILNAVHTVSQLPARNTREQMVDGLDRELLNWQKNIGPRCTYPRPDDRHPTRTRFITHAWYHIAMILLHRPFIPRHRDGQVFVSNVHHKRATEHANQLVDLLARFAAGADIDKLPPNDAYLIFTAAVIQVFNFCANDATLRDAARPRLEKCIEWLRGLAGTWSAASQFKHLLDTFSQVASNSMMSRHAPRAMGSPQDEPTGQDSNVIMHGQPQTGHHEMSYQSSTPSRSDAMQTQSESDYKQSQDPSHGVMTEMQQRQSRVAPHQPSVQTIHADAEAVRAGSGAMQTDSTAEQGFYAPELFTLENYYWNNYQALGMQQQQQMPGTMGSYPAHSAQTHTQVQPQTQPRPSGEMGTQGQQGQPNNVYFHLMHALGDTKPRT